MTPKKPRVNKSKDEIAWEMQQRAATQRKRDFIATKFFPMLLAHMKNVTQAKNFCKVVQNDLLMTFNEGMSKAVGTLEMSKRLDEVHNEAADAYRAVLEVFKDSPINEALELLDGMPNAIDAALQVNDRERPLADLEWDNGSLKVKKHE